MSDYYTVLDPIIQTSTTAYTRDLEGGTFWSSCFKPEPEGIIGPPQKRQASVVKRKRKTDRAEERRKG
jgi:hypothetical protein